MLRKVIGENLKSCRKRMNLSQYGVADLSDMEQKTISKIENYMENIGVDKLDQLCNGLGIHPYELVIYLTEIKAGDLLEKICFSKGVIEMLWQYYKIVSNILNEEICPVAYRTYGIGLEGKELPCVQDLSTDEQFVESVIALCNANQVSSDQLLYVIEDALYENEQIE